MIMNAVLMCILGFMGVTINLQRSVLISKSVKTETQISTDCSGQITWHMAAPQGNSPFTCSAISKGILTREVPASVIARFKMRYSYSFLLFTFKIVLMTRRFPVAPKQVITLSSEIAAIMGNAFSSFCSLPYSCARLDLLLWNKKLVLE